MHTLLLKGPSKPFDTTLEITGSKSISNRVLIMRALCNEDFHIDNLSTSDDTLVLLKGLEASQEKIDCHHAGTSFRFLTAFYAIQDGTQILTGSSRLQERPMGPLVDALINIGAKIEYLNEKGFPPLKILPFKYQTKNEISIPADISSQFISALCLIAPSLPKGLNIQLDGNLVSKPYLQMTLSLMRYFGVHVNSNETQIIIKSQPYTPKNFVVESDWSSASYLFAIASLVPESKLRLKTYLSKSLQGDAKIITWFEQFGVQTTFDNTQSCISIEHTGKILDNSFHINFIEQPDMAQTISCLCAAKEIDLKLSGLKTLKIKETDRVEALQNELSKVNINLTQTENELYNQTGTLDINLPCFETYNDHRMAMALSILAVRGPIKLKDPHVVKKSYPKFWAHLKQLGFEISILEE